jgi:cell division transport system ATP-binding protein
MISFSHVVKRYPGGYEALVDVSFDLPKGELAFVTGHSGAGKSTLLKLIALIERPTRGQIVVNGMNLVGIRRRDLPHFRRQVGFVFQSHRLLFDRSVFDNVALPLIIAGYGPQETGKRVRGALDLVGLLDKERRAPVALSAGEQQRVGIARAMVNRPPLLLADEPTGNLDPALSREVMDIFEWIQRSGTTVLVATHNLMLVREREHPIIVLRQGRLVDELPEGII